MDPLVSIVMPAYNAAAYIDEAVRSVLAQTYTNWELYIVNDGSTDSTPAILTTFTDPRIHVLHKANGGIGSARNMAMDQLKGDFFCCLDADDVLPQRSLEARLKQFSAADHVSIVDGQVQFMDRSLRKLIRRYVPQRSEIPFHELVTFSGKCYMGLSWMMRWGPNETLRFHEGITHAEDLLFCLMYSKGRAMLTTDETVLLYRRSGNTSMTTNFEGMEHAFHTIGRTLKRDGYATLMERITFTYKYRRIMSGTYWNAGKRWKALNAWIK